MNDLKLIADFGAAVLGGFALTVFALEIAARWLRRF